MNFNSRLVKCGIAAALLAFALIPLLTPSALAADLSGSYSWKPVKIGAGGWMQGMVIHPTNSAVKYARGDVDNIYRWDNTNSVWIPIEVSSALPANVVADPVDAFPGPIAVDPSNSNVVLCTWTFNRSADTEASHPSLPMSVYRSTNGGLSFVASNLSLTGELSQEHRGERMAIDPNNGNIVYFGSPSQGLWRSMDGGLTWSNVSANGAPASTAAAFLPRFDGGAGTIAFGGQTVSRRVYVSVDGGSVLKSDDGGNTWTNITNAGQNECDGHPEYMTVDQTGRLMIVNGGNDHIDVYSRAGVWSQMVTPHNLAGFAVDPNNSSRIFGMGQGGNLSRTTNNGVNWTDLGGSLMFSSTQEIQWLRPSASRPQGHAVSTSGLYMDSGGKLWCPAANDGIITCVPNDATDTLSNPPVWSSQSQGIEEMVAQHLTIPPGGNPICMVEDEAFFTIFNPDLYTAQHTPFDLWTGGSGLALGMDVAYCWNQPHYIVETAENAPQNGHRFSGYSTDGGTTWSKFASINNLTHPCVLYNGAIAVAPRLAGHQNDGPGGDMIVWSPTKANSGTVPAPFYSTDGGATWTQTHAFDSLQGALLNVNQCGTGVGYTYMPDGQSGDWGIYIHQHQLEADAINRGTFYWDTTTLGFYKTTDGGVNWTKMTGNGLPRYTHHGQLQSNPYTSGDLWLAAGFEGSDTHGLFHTTDSGNNWTRSAAFTHAWEMALGKSATVGGYPTIFVYGQLSTDANWGVFRSTDAGVTWDRISYYPMGLIDFPSSSSASWDTFGQYYIGFGGNSFCYGTPSGPPPIPNPPTGLTATAGNAQITLNWISSPNATSYNVYRGTTTGGENATAIATGIGGLTYTNTGLTNGTAYYYKVTATDASGTSGYSNEASAVPAPQAPPAPTGVIAISGDTQISLIWSAATGATSYNVYRSTTIGGETLLVSGISTTSYTNTGLTNGTLYYYYVKAVNATGTSAQSVEVSNKPSAANAQIPFASTAPTIDGTVDAVWSGATSYPMANVTGTIPTGATNSGSWQALWDSTNLYVLVTMQDSTVLANNDSVEVYIEGNDAKGGAYNSVTWQWVFINGAGIQEYQSGNSGSNITGIVKADGVLTGGWRMEAKIPWSTIGVSGIASDNIGLDVVYNNFNVSGTRANKLFWWSTTDNDWSNPGLYGTAKLMPSGSGGIPLAPTGLTATPGNAQVALSWSASTGATSYGVLRSTVSGSGYASVATGVATTAYTNTGLTNGMTYYFVVNATNTSGTSPNSTQASATPVAPPAAPTGLTATAGDSQVVLSWAASLGATSYNVKRSTVSGSGYAQVTNVATTSYTNTGLTNGTTYYFVVSALNAGGESANSAQASTTPVASGDTTQYNFEAGTQNWAASGLTGLSVASSTTKAFLGTHSLGLTFASSPAGTAEISIGSPNPTTPAGATVTYHVWIPSGSTITSVKAYVLGGSYVSTSYPIASLTVNAWNTLSVTLPASGCAPLGSLGIDFTTSATYSGTIYADSVDWPAGGPPPAPTGLTATPGNTQVALSWTASSGATSYNVLRSTGSGSGYASVAMGIVPTNYTNTGLTNGTTYYFVVTATNAGGTSPNSAQASATPSAGNTHAGTWACKAVLTATATFNNLDQTVNTPASTAYTASFWLKGGGKVTLRVFMGSGTEITRQTFIATSTWTQCSISFNTGASTSTKFNITDDGGVAGTAYIDDCFMGAGTNVLTNAGFESGNTVWTPQSPPFTIVQNP